jgi:hypothetical protein
VHAHAGLSRVAISRCLRSSSRVQRQERVRRDASTSHADAGGYPSAEPFAKVPRARSASTAPSWKRDEVRVYVSYFAFCDRPWRLPLAPVCDHRCIAPNRSIPRELLAGWLLFAITASAVFITYARLPAREPYNVTGSGLVGGASRVLVFFNFPTALAAIAVVALAFERRRSDPPASRLHAVQGWNSLLQRAPQNRLKEAQRHSPRQLKTPEPRRSCRKLH